MLLNFTREEEEMLKQTLEYKVGISFPLPVFILCPEDLEKLFRIEEY